VVACSCGISSLRSAVRPLGCGLGGFVASWPDVTTRRRPTSIPP